MNLQYLLYNAKTGSLISTEQKLKWYVAKNGYYRTKIDGNTYSKHLLIHDLLGIDRTGFVVIHRDGDKLNNRAENLELMTRGEANKHFFNIRNDIQTNN